MQADTVIARSGGMVEADIGGELVGLHIERGTCFGFNATAADVWRLLETPRSFAALCAAVMDSYEVDAQTCAAEVAALLARLRDEGLVTLTAAA